MNAMKDLLRRLAAVALIGGFATAAGAQTRPAPKKPPATPPSQVVEAPAPTADEQIKTSDQLKRESVQGAATSPLRDLNVVKSAIPQVLLGALSDPYARPPRNWKCSTLLRLVQPLDAALGPDIDRLPSDDEDLMDQGKETAFGVAGDLASGAIPFRGVVRRLSGAASHDRLVQSAIIAGNVRRAYMKGLGETKGCVSPAAPSHERTVTAAAAVEEVKGARSKYPTRTDAPRTPGEKPPAAPAKPRS